jgi:hypothetical protein
MTRPGDFVRTGLAISHCDRVGWLRWKLKCVELFVRGLIGKRLEEYHEDAEG